MGINIRKKGADGELELCKRLQPFFPNTLQRNLEQVRSGGADVDGAHPFVIEVKRVQDTGNGNKNSWWKQVKAAITDLDQEIPIVAFRPNKAKWRYLVPFSLILSGRDGWAEIDEDQFLMFVIYIFELEAK